MGLRWLQKIDPLAMYLIWVPLGLEAALVADSMCPTWLLLLLYSFPSAAFAVGLGMELRWLQGNIDPLAMYLIWMPLGLVPSENPM